MQTILGSQVGITRRRLTLLMAFFGASATSTAWPSHAQSFPDRPIKIVVPFAAGGPTDVIARLIGQSMTARLGKSVLIENLAGAGGRIGAKAAAGAPADGYTLLLGGTNVNAMLGAIYKDLGFDPAQSFVPVAAICTDSMALGVNPGLSARTLEDLIDFAKRNPGQLKYGAPQGIYTHFAGEFFKIKTGTDIMFVPYKGGAPAYERRDRRAHRHDLQSEIHAAAPVQGQQAAAAGGDERKALAGAPETPTMEELGVSGFPAEVWFGLLAPAGTPPSVVDMLNAAVNEGLGSPEMR
jgi:tripartite-type tricarboxylate transporter receptor subunit TctC